MANVLSHLSIDIPPDLAVDLGSMCEDLHKSEHEFVIEALKTYIEDMKDSRDVYLAYQEWKKTGEQDISFEQVLAEIETAERSS